jgi:hypothetical protein
MSSSKLRSEVTHTQKETGIGPDRDSAEFAQLAADDSQCNSVEKSHKNWARQKVGYGSQPQTSGDYTEDANHNAKGY